MQSTEARELFQHHGIRPTRRREAVYGALRGTKRHPTADELRIMVLDSGCALSIATVYSTLELFCREGMINRMSTPGRPDRFDATVENHLHLYLQDTGEILDVPDDLASLIMNSVDSGMIGIVEKQMGVQVDQVGVHLIGRREPLKDSEAT